MNSCNHENDHNSIVVHGNTGCGICYLLNELERAEDEIKELEAEVARLKDQL